MQYSDRCAFHLCLTIILTSIPVCFFVILYPKTVISFFSNDVVSSKVSSSPPLVLLISYDGFRWDYIERNNNTPTFRWLIQNGVYATKGLKNSYITITAPNHYGIVTGLYEESHGIIANSFYDPDLKENFEYFTTRWKTNPKFFKGVPIWNLNDQAYPRYGTGCVMWVGCDVPIQGHLPLHYVSWDENLTWTARIDSLISWFTHPDKPINMGILYIEEPDETGHQHGPDHPGVNAMVSKLDQLTAYLMTRLSNEKLLDRLNIIFTADHGMASLPTSNAISIDNYVNRSLYTLYGGTPNWNVDPKPGHEAEVYNALKGKVPHLSVYNKTDIPLEYHYRNSSRIMPIQLLADEHWWITHNNSERQNSPKTIEMSIRGKRIVRNYENVNSTTGTHGYDNSFPDMHPYFIGFGPAFKKGYNITQFSNLDIFPLISYILNITPTPNNGSFENVRMILKDEGRRSTGDTGSFPEEYACSSFLPVLMLLLSLLLLLLLLILKKFKASKTDEIQMCNEKDSSSLIYFA